LRVLPFIVVPQPMLLVIFLYHLFFGCLSFIIIIISDLPPLAGDVA
jgi:hypothetical protein